MSSSSLALVNLRAAVILIVLAFHSVLPYLAFLPPTPYPFDQPPYLWLAFPIIDSQRWFGFDLFCAWQDVGLMSLMFFLSGLFVPSSLAGKGSRKFLSDRLLRIGLPMALAVIFLSPLAYYAAYRTTAVDPGLDAFWQSWLALPFWPCGPQWFLGQLVAFNILAAGIHRFIPGWNFRLARLAALADENPVRFGAGFAAISAAAYIPLLLTYSPFAWINVGPMAFQPTRPLHYLAYFLAGMAVGAHGLDRGLLRPDGILAQRWIVWLAAAFASFLLWAAATSATLPDWENAPLAAKLATGTGFAVACATSCLCSLAICLRFAHWRARAFDSLSANAYRIYLIHYVFAVWLQYALLGIGLFAIGKAVIVFCGTLIASWSMAAALGGALPVLRPRETVREARGA
ncbi:acyltransferase [Bradyrhizobium sp. CB3481]|uniref:acyltransferase family protein n=1 Tax=Bradyrhizobium sp. CB3481 TaxID=3039158 RepID=UPI0024B0C641|nr:acyltransferase [Bradyrhizobium sp. CB3481]WFU19105.1 acyltransferase [Bradyrhizobium sp. CB3481]